jgi:hypothetical protein
MQITTTKENATKIIVAMNYLKKYYIESLIRSLKFEKSHPRRYKNGSYHIDNRKKITERIAQLDNVYSFIK